MLAIYNARDLDHVGVLLFPGAQGRRVRRLHLREARPGSGVASGGLHGPDDPVGGSLEHVQEVAQRQTLGMGDFEANTKMEAGKRNANWY